MAPVDVDREVTPALVRGRRGSVAVLREGELAPGLEGQLAHHVFADGAERRLSTVVLTAVPEGVAFAPALACRDRRELGGGIPAQLPSERWSGVELESTAFNRRYRLLTLAGQDAIYTREVFAPALIDWLSHDVPAGFSFELNERSLLVAVPGHIAEPEELDRLCGLAAELARRLREEAEEEGDGTGLYDESAQLAAIEKGLEKVRFEEPPASVGIAVEAFREAARHRPTVLLRAAFWGLLGFGVVAVPIALIFGPLVALVPGALVGWLCFWIGGILAAADYEWGTASVRRLGLEAFFRGYAASRGLREGDRWRFHARHRHLPLPGTVAHVLSGRDAPSGREVSFLTLGDAAELRSRGVEVAYSAQRPLAAMALVAELPSPAAADRLAAIPRAEGLHVERDRATVAIWRSASGNLAFSAAGFDRFRAEAGAFIAQADGGGMLSSI